ncbi:MAG: ABC-type transport auxiliary lipoprotein family protein [Sphingomonadaceae bacterium]
MRIVFAFVLVLLLGGCIRLSPRPPAQLLTLSAAQSVAAATTRNAAAGATVVVFVPSAAPPISTTRVPVYEAETAVAYVKDAVLADSPSRQFARLLLETIGARTGRVVLDLRQSTAQPGLRLQGTLQRFGIDAAGMQAVVSYDGVIVRNDGSVVTRRFEARAPLAVVEPRPVGVALNVAANDVAAQVSDWVGNF